MHSRSSLLPARVVARRTPAIPVGSVLASVNRKADALVTIGRWRVVFIPDDPLEVAAGRSGPLAWASDPDLGGHQQEPGFRSGRLELELADPEHSELEPRGDGSDCPSIPDGIVWIDVEKAAERLSTANDRDQGIGTRLAAASASDAVALGPLGSVSLSAASWALLSQVFWVPLLAIDAHDRWVSRQREIMPPGQPLPPSPIAQATTPLPFNGLLGAARPLPPLAGQADQAGRVPLAQVVPQPSSGIGVMLSRAGSMLDRPFTSSFDTPAVPSPGAGRAAAIRLPRVAPLEGLGILGRSFTPAQLLGGSVSLADLHEGPMAPLALAERALQRSGNDPLAPLPALWREPMRQALLKLPGAPQQLDTARVVYMPSSSVSQPVEVPLALQSDGSVDILEAPANAALLREINSWSRQQRPPASGSLVPAVVHLHPLPQEAPIAPRSASATTTSRAPAISGPSSVTAASTAPIPVPITSETPPPIPVPIVSEAPASVAPSAAGPGDPVVPAP